MEKNKRWCPFQVLGVRADSSMEEISKKAKALIFAEHPDKNLHRAAEAAEQTSILTIASTILRDDFLRPFFEQYGDYPSSDDLEEAWTDFEAYSKSENQKDQANQRDHVILTNKEGCPEASQENQAQAIYEDAETIRTATVPAADDAVSELTVFIKEMETIKIEASTAIKESRREGQIRDLIELVSKCQNCITAGNPKTSSTDLKVSTAVTYVADVRRRCVGLQKSTKNNKAIQRLLNKAFKINLESDKKIASAKLVWTKTVARAELLLKCFPALFENLLYTIKHVDEERTNIPAHISTDKQHADIANAKLVEKHAETEEKLNMALTECAQIKEKFVSLKKMYRNLEESNLHLQKSNSKQAESIVFLNSRSAERIQQLKNFRDGQKVRIDNLQAKVEESATRIDQLTKENEQIQEMNSQIESEKLWRTNLQNELENIKTTKCQNEANLQQQLISTQQDLRMTGGEAVKAQELVSAMSKELAEAKLQISRLEIELKTEKFATEKLKLELDKMTMAGNENDARISQLSIYLDASHKEVSLLTTTKDKLELQLDQQKLQYNTEKTDIGLQCDVDNQTEQESTGTPKRHCPEANSSHDHNTGKKRKLTMTNSSYTPSLKLVEFEEDTEHGKENDKEQKEITDGDDEGDNNDDVMGDKVENVANDEQEEQEEEQGQFVCDTCGRRYSLATNLTRHAKIHQPDYMPWECDRCGQKFDRKDSLKKHKRRVFKCTPTTNTEIISK